MHSLSNDCEKILCTQEEIAVRVRELGEEITRDYQGKNLLLLGILRGAVVFFADLAREIDVPMEMDFMAVSSYGAGVNTTGTVRILKDLDGDVEGKDILIVEDILDTGLTMHNLTRLLETRKPASIRVAALLDKPERRKVDIRADYAGFTIPDAFVVGYGLDYAQKYRNLPFIGVLSPKVYMHD